MKITEISKDPEEVRALKNFKVIKEETFEDLADQEEARARYFQQEIARGKKEGDQVSLKPGDIVSRGGVFQEIKSPFVVKLASATHDFATSEPLPDRSIVHVPTGLTKTTKS